MLVVEILRFDPVHAELISSWPNDTADCLAWCSAESVSAADVATWSAAGAADHGVEAWVVAFDGVPVGYGELWIDDDENEVELAHLIVAPDHRSVGVGRQLVAALTERGAARHDTIVLRVRPENLAAQRCYAAAGFLRVSECEEAEWNVGQPLAYVWMRH